MTRVSLVRKNKISESGLVSILTSKGFEVEEIVLDDKYNESIKALHSGIIVLDVNTLSSESEDVSFVEYLRRLGDTPILLITHREERAAYREKMLDAGVDVCLERPFAPDELFLRIVKLVARSSKLACVGTTIVVSDLSVDIKDRSVFYKKKNINLTKTEYDILLYLLLHKNLPVSREELTNRCLFSARKESSSIHIHIYNLRKKINNSKIIKTVPLYGFTLVDEFSLA